MQKILLPVDGCKSDREVSSFTANIARRLNASVVVLAVIEDNRCAEVPTHDSNQHLKHLDCVSRAATLALKTNSNLSEIVDRLSGQGVKATPMVRSGNPAEAIVHECKVSGCSLIIMATHGRSTFGRAILGSVTDQVIRSTDVPVLEIAPHRTKKLGCGDAGISRLLVLLDGTQFSERSLQYLGRLASELSSEVVLVRIVDLRLTDSNYGTPEGTIIEMARLANKASEYLRDIAGRLQERGLTVRRRVVVGDVRQSVVSLANETSDQLVVLATHGRSGLARWVSGSVTESLIQDANAPVLVIPPNYSPDDAKRSPLTAQGGSRFSGYSD